MIVLFRYTCSTVYKKKYLYKITILTLKYSDIL